jgi:uracil-DNA glycosylase
MIKVKNTETLESPAAENADGSDIQSNRDREVSGIYDRLCPPTSVQVGAAKPAAAKKRLPRAPAIKGAPRKAKVSSDQVYPEEFDGLMPPGAPEGLLKNTRIGPALHLAGYGHQVAPVPVMFIGPCALPYEIDDTKGDEICSFLRSAEGDLLLRNLERAGFQSHEWHYTAVARFAVPKQKLTRPVINWSLPLLRHDIERLRPGLIVCFGKQVFDLFMKPRLLRMKDVMGGWFSSPLCPCPVYVMDGLSVPLLKPEFMDRFNVDLRAVRMEMQAKAGATVVEVPRDYIAIDRVDQLVNVMLDLATQKVRQFAVDCEWKGQTWVNGELRCFQFAWAPGKAAFIKLLDQRGTYQFDQPLDVVKQIIAPVFNHPEVRFIGHNGSADMPWMHEHLGIEVWNRFVFDTMYAQHTINEYADLKLERLSVRFTDLGRYDLDLLDWKKRSKFDEDDNDGYGKVPDKIMDEYAPRDVDCTFRCEAPLRKQLVDQGLMPYYRSFVVPFVTDGFYEMMTCGLPVDLDYLNDMRAVFVRNRDYLVNEFRVKLAAEAYSKLEQVLRTLSPGNFQDLLIEIERNLSAGSVETAREIFKSIMPDAATLDRNLAVFEHAANVWSFNVNSQIDLRRWLFNVKGLLPIKTTKRDGFALSWDKVMAMSETDRINRGYQPAIDKQVIKIYAETDPMLAHLQEMRAVATIVKSFLREPDAKGREMGIHKWVQNDNRIHANFALTETARPRAWKPNVLNFPKVVTKPIESAFERINKKIVAELEAKYAHIPAEDEQQRAVIQAEIARQTKVAMCLRSNIVAPEGHCLVDMDLKTAEVVALAYQSGDKNMIKVLTEPDTQFARIDRDNPKKVVRIEFNENEGISESEYDPALLTSKDDPRILRDENGQIVHPRRDLHWEMATTVARKPREKLDERLFRDGVGKIGNFCLLEGQLVTTSRGKIPIEAVRPYDLLWDGEEWVSHEGVVCNGVMVTHFYQGLWATDNHEVYIEDGREVLFGEARKQGFNLKRIKDEGSHRGTNSRTSSEKPQAVGRRKQKREESTIS